MNYADLEAVLNLKSENLTKIQSRSASTDNTAPKVKPVDFKSGGLSSTYPSEPAYVSKPYPSAAPATTPYPSTSFPGGTWNRSKGIYGGSDDPFYDAMLEHQNAMTKKRQLSPPIIN